VRELVAKPAVQRNPRHLVASNGVEHDQAFGKHGEPADRVGQAEHIEHPEHVGTKLNAGAHLGELRRLLEHAARHALLRQGERRGEPADAASDDEDTRVS
jgi:hypothetical protein